MELLQMEQNEMMSSMFITFKKRLQFNIGKIVLIQSI